MPEHPAGLFLHTLFEAHAARDPEALAVWHEGRGLTYGALDRQANRLAWRLQAAGVGPEVRVGLFLDRSPEALVGLLAIWKAGGAYVPLEPTLPRQRLDFLLEELRPHVILTREPLRSSLPPHPAALLCVDEGGEEEGTAPPRCRSAADSLAYILHTSGSTGLPKGVLLEHRGLINLVRTLVDTLDVRPRDRVLQFASLAFDASLFEVGMALAAGATLHLATGEARTSGVELGELFFQHAITHVALLPSVLATVPTRALPALRVVVCGGERCPEELVARWREGRRFFNTYGPTEATVSATLFECDGTGAPPLGRPLPGVVVHVLDTAGTEAADGSEGELAIGGVGLARGYLDRPDLEASRFVPDPFGRDGRLYRTGDRGRRRADGHLEFLGRIDDQVKVRGFRVEPGEIEAVLTEHPEVREAAVVPRDDASGGTRLTAYVLPAGAHPPSVTSLRRFLEARLPEYMIPAAFVALAALPRLPSGKLDRRALPSPGEVRPALDTPFVEPRTPVEQTLARVWSEVLRVSEVGVADEFLALGGDSLSAARVSTRLRAVGIPLSGRDILERRTIAALVEHVAGGATSAGQDGEIPQRAGDEPAPLSFVQQQLWLLHQLAPHGAAYNLPAVLRLRGALDVAVLQRSLEALVQRHEVLRTTFPGGEGTSPLQQVRADVAVPLPVVDLSALPEAERTSRLEALSAEQALRPFQLVEGPLVRAVLVHLGAREHALVIVFHHLVCDGGSMEVFLRELAVLYTALLEGSPAPLSPLPIRYGDFAVWQRQWMRGEALDAELAFWKRELEGAPTRMMLPLDRPRPALQRFRGAQLPWSLPADTTRALQELGQARGSTLFMTLLAGFSVLLHAEGAEEDLLIGTTVAGRERSETRGLIGHFANTLVLRVRLGEAPRFGDVLDRVRERALAAYAHAALPFEKLVEALRPERDASHNPLFQVAFGLHPGLPPVTSGPLEIDLAQLHADAAPFDLSLQLWTRPGGEGLEGVLLYSTDLFDTASIARLGRRLRALVERVSVEPEVSIAELLRLDAPADRRGCEALETALAEEPAVLDCAVRMRPTESSGQQRVAYVVSSEPLTPTWLARRLNEKAPAELHPRAVVPLASLPRRPDGRVDEEALSRIPIPDSGLAQRTEAMLRATPGAGEVAVLVHAPTEPAPRLHLWRVLPGGMRGAAPELDAPARSASAPTTPSRPPALSDGGPLVLPHGAPETLVDALVRAASGTKGVRYVQPGGAVVFQSYASLLNDARALLAGLTRAGLEPGARVILHIEATKDLLTTFWACVLGGIQPVTVALAPSYDAPNGVLTKLQGTWELLGRPHVIASRALVEPLQGLRAFLPMDGLRVLAVEDLWGDPSRASPAALRPDDIAFFQLSSGSTGMPKVIQETHRGILLHAHSVSRFCGYVPEDVTLNWIPFDHVVPILTCHLKDVCVGCEQIHVKTERILADPLAWLDLIECYRVTQTFSPNFGLRLVSDAVARAPGRRTWDLSSLRFLLNAGEQVTLGAIREFLQATAPFGVRPEVMQPAFGMAEACTIVSYQNAFSVERGAHHVAKASLGGALEFLPAGDETSIAFIDLGPPVPGVQLRITDASNRLLPEGSIGRLQLKGGVVTPGYLDNPSANQEAFVGGGWFNTGDLGFLWQGRLTITGREKEVIIIRGANFHCHEIEDVVGSLPGVEPTFAAACSVVDPDGGTEGLALFFVPREPSIEVAARVAGVVREQVTKRLGVTPTYVIPLARSEFPKTTSGKIQRVALQRALTAGRFRSTIEAVDLQLGNERTLADWFFRPEWRRKSTHGVAVRKGASLLFCDSQGPGARVAHQLQAEGRTCVTVEPGAGFARLGPRRYSIDPTVPEHYPRVLAAVFEEAGPIAEVVHLWTHGAPGMEVCTSMSGARSLLLLVQALASVEDLAPRRLVVVSSHAQAVSPDDAPDWTKAPLLALVKTVSRELPWLDCRHVDLPAADLEDDAACITRELAARSRDREVAWRGGERRVAGLERVDPAVLPEQSPPFEEGGAYVLAGGLGGIGVELSRYLLRQHRARLLLVGRTPFARLSQERAKAYAELEQLAHRAGGQVRYESVDVADAPRLRDTVERAKAWWGRELSGVLHLAGTFDERRLLEERPEDFSAALHARGAGIMALHGLLDGRSDRLFGVFSSVNGFFGGHSAGAYSAASRLVEHFVQDLRRKGHTRAYCLSWSFWDAIGMNRESPAREAALASGFQAISATAGLTSLLVALHRNEPQLLIGLDGRHRAIARSRWDAAPESPRLTAWVTSTEGASTLPESLLVRDDFGTPMACRLVRVERIPRTPEGLPDVALLGGGEAARSRPPHVAPHSEAEQRIATIWREALGLDKIGIHDNFFSLGGHSMLVAQVSARLQQAFSREVAAVDLFRHPTVRSLAEYLGRAVLAPPGLTGVDERARKQRDALERRRLAAESMASRRGR
ncbi:non-ribosomal peptide synthetase [Pyxidicoccus sp. MSG2]|uniref:non-ribosomal peptide synthetase n=1 Tax=Pyxidicoccus sp. MSG2 TaxID=2996790 RepID=UPI0022715CFE|nr:non-ribosomal peptide synthetase [Pyxidicoccus sp. MSG2]MCY1022294.1 amino acid adenylation domain-containing protein [Pyxidicoccus sp. MSG2]